MKSIKFYALLLGIFSIFNVNATLISNSNSITDTSTGLEWLNLSETIGMNYNTILTETSTGGSLEGWQLATFSQFIDLMGSAGATSGQMSSLANNCCSTSVSSTQTVYQTLMQIGWGTSSNHGQYSDIWFHVEDIDGTGNTSGVIIDNGGAYTIFSTNFSNASSNYPFIGSALIRSDSSGSNPIPEPSTIALFLLAIAGLKSRKLKL